MKIYLFFILILLSAFGFNTISQKIFQQRWSVWLGYGFPALIMMIFLGIVSIPPRYDWFNDFINCYYIAGRLVIENPSKLYSLGDFGFVNIPIIASAFSPFAILNNYVATITFTLLGILAVSTTCYLLIKLLKLTGWRRVAIIGLFIINGPLYHSIWYGNLTHFTLLILLLALICLKKKRDVLLGVLLAIAALIKVPLFLLGIYFALRKKWRVVAGYSATLLIIGGASLVVFGFDLHFVWLKHIGKFAGKALVAYNVQSVDGFLARLLLEFNGDLRNWQPIGVDGTFNLVRTTLKLILLGGTAWIFWRKKAPITLEQENLEFSIVLCLTLLISPISWTHYYLFLILPFSLYIGNKLAVPQGKLWYSLIISSIFLISLPVITPDISSLLLKNLYARLLVSHYFFGGVLLLGTLLAARSRISKSPQLSPNFPSYQLRL